MNTQQPPINNQRSATAQNHRSKTEGQSTQQNDTLLTESNVMTNAAPVTLIPSAPTATSALVPSTDNYDLLSQYSGAGSENVTSDDRTVPFLKLLQSNSPEVVDSTSDKYIASSKMGDIINSSTRQNYGSVIQFIPVYYDRNFIEYIPRDAGGGFVASYSRSSDVLDGTYRDGHKTKTKDDNHEIVDTAYFWGMVINGGALDPICLTMTSTKLKVATNWNAQIMAQFRNRPDGRGKFALPYFGCAWNIESVVQKNSKGVFSNYKISYSCDISKREYLEQCAAFYEMIKSGVAKIDMAAGATYESDDTSFEVGELTGANSATEQGSTDGKTWY